MKVDIGMWIHEKNVTTRQKIVSEAVWNKSSDEKRDILNVKHVDQSP